MSAFGLLTGTHELIVGVEDDPGGLASRVYVNSRSEGRYYLVSDPDARAEIERAWRRTDRHLTCDRESLRAVGVLLRDAA